MKKNTYTIEHYKRDTWVNRLFFSLSLFSLGCVFIFGGLAWLFSDYWLLVAAGISLIASGASFFIAMEADYRMNWDEMP